MSLADLIQSRFTFGLRLNDPKPVTADNYVSWLLDQLAAPIADDPAVSTRLAQVQLPVTFVAHDGTTTTQNLGITDLFKSSAELVAIMQRDTSANQAMTGWQVQQVAAARWIRAAFSPWQTYEVMVDFWHNHFSVDSYQNDRSALFWPVYDQLIRVNALGNFRTLLGATAKSAAMMYFLNQNLSMNDHPNENFAREVMELHTLGIARYLGETTPSGAAGTGYSDQDVTEAARVLTGWTIADGYHPLADGSTPMTGEFMFCPAVHDPGSKVIFGQSFPAGVGEAEGERFLDMLAQHPGTAQTIANKLYTRFVQDVPPADDTLVAAMADTFQQNVNAPNQIALVLETLLNSPEFAASAGQKVKTPFEFFISAIRATGAEINRQFALGAVLESMGQPMFHWPAPNGAPDVAAAWSGTNNMILRWSLSDPFMGLASGIILDGPNTVFAQIAPKVKAPTDAAVQIVQSMLGSSATVPSFLALAAYAQTPEVLAAPDAITNPAKLNAGLRRLAGAVIATPEFQIR